MQRATLITILNGWRSRMALTKLEVGRRIGVSRQLVSAWLTVDGPLTPSCEQVVDFGRACGVQADEIGGVVLSMLRLTAIPDGAPRRDAADQQAA